MRATPIFIMWKKVVYDIETPCNLFIYCDIDVDTGDRNTFIVHKSKNDFNELIKYLTGNKLSQIGYNNVSFDSQVIQYIIENKKRMSGMEDSDKLAREICSFANETIRRSKNDEFPLYPEWKMSIPQLDLFKIWHFNNRNKSTSLKWVQFSMDWHNVEEMPWPHTKEVPESVIDDMVFYCTNDILSTLAFYNITIGKTEHPLYKGVDKIELRRDIYNTFGIKCFNYNDVKIGDEINKQKYLELSGRDWYDVKGTNSARNEIRAIECIAPFIRFKSEKLTNFLNKIKKEVFTSTKGGFSEEFEYKGVYFTFAKGGIHSIDSARKIIPKSDEILEDRDVASLYPATILNLELYPEHLGPEWLVGYRWIFDERLSAKSKGKTDKKYKAVAEAYKLALNGGGYGKTGEETSWQYDPKLMMTVTLTNQLTILMLCESYLDNGIEVISANTDGVLIKFKKHQEDVVRQIDKEWMEMTRYTLEFARYSKFIQTSVNDYIALKIDDPDPKKKGDFVTEFDIHKDKSARVVPIALEKYYIEGVPIETTIMNHRNIYDFCIGLKSERGFYYEARWEENNRIRQKVLQKVVRYNIVNTSEGAVKIVKCHPTKNESQVNAGSWRMDIFNLYREEKNWDNYNINYMYYIEECYKIINKIKEPKEGFTPITGVQMEMGF
jgi:hypothetical protein